MFAVNHPAHGDPFVVFEAMARLRAPCCYLAAWHVFTGWMGLKGFAFQRLGAFSIDREGTDLRAFRTAADVLAQGDRSLVIFPEGDVYHLNDRITPLREGALRTLGYAVPVEDHLVVPAVVVGVGVALGKLLILVVEQLDRRAVAGRETWPREQDQRGCDSGVAGSSQQRDC